MLGEVGCQAKPVSGQVMDLFQPIMGTMVSFPRRRAPR